MYSILYFYFLYQNIFINHILITLEKYTKLIMNKYLYKSLQFFSKIKQKYMCGN